MSGEGAPTVGELERWLAEKRYLTEGCRELSVEDGRGWVAEGGLAGDQLAAFARLVDRPPAGSVVCKFGSRSFVGICPMGSVVLKYYYRLSLRRQLGYTLWGTRGMRSWMAGRAFGYLGIPTPGTLGLKETRRFGFLADRTFLATAFCEGQALPEFVEEHGGEEEALREVAAGCGKIFARLAAYRIRHGDATPKNFLVRPDRSVVVVDLDAVKFLVPEGSWPAKRDADLGRFSQLWKRRPEMPPCFKDAFEGALASGGRNSDG